jgi:hypothetical protein
VTSVLALLPYGIQAALVLVLAGVFTRRRQQLCKTFPMYLVVVLILDSAAIFWPDRFHVGWFWMLRQSLWDLAKLSVAIEVALRTFRRFPGARPVAQGVMAGMLTLSTLVVIGMPAVTSYNDVALSFEPQVLTGTIWLMTAVALLVVWYRIPIHDFQKAILLGFVVYLTIFATLLNVLRHHGWTIREWVNSADAVAYLTLCLYWAHAAWRKDAPGSDSPVLARLELDR